MQDASINKRAAVNKTKGNKKTIDEKNESKKIKTIKRMNKMK